MAVKVRYCTENTDNWETYWFTGGIYIGFDEQIRNALTMYDISGYQNLFSSENILDSWQLGLSEQGEGNGEEQWQPGDDPKEYNQRYDLISIVDIQAKPLGTE